MVGSSSYYTAERLRGRCACTARLFLFFLFFIINSSRKKLKVLVKYKLLKAKHTRGGLKGDALPEAGGHWSVVHHWCTRCRTTKNMWRMEEIRIRQRLFEMATINESDILVHMW